MRTQRLSVNSCPCRAAIAAVSVIAVAGVASLRPGYAQTYPERSVRIIVPTAPGGSIDTSGRLRTLAVTTRQRVARLAEVPTIDESGAPGYDVATWIGAFAPAATPKAITGKIGADIGAALAMPEVRGKLEALSMEIRGGSSEELRNLLATDMAKWGRLVKEKNIQVAQ